MARHPDQPLIKDSEGVLRFKENKIVSYLASDRLNDLEKMPFDQEDRVQLAQLIGYSLDGYVELHYVSDEDYLRVANQPAGEISSPGKPKLKTYIVYTYTQQDGGVLSASARQVTVENVYTWAIEDGRLTFRDGNREYIAIFNQWLYFIKDNNDNE